MFTSIEMFKRLRRAALLTVGATALAMPTVSFADLITIAPGGGPAGGYLALSLFGIAPIAGVGDDTITNFNTPSFDYAGQSWSSLGVVSNGYVVVGGGTAADVSLSVASLPNPSAPKNILAPFWTDLNPAAGGGIRIGTLTNGTDTWIVVDWAAVRNFSDTITNTFEIWIGINTDPHPGEDITFSYGNVGTGDPGTGLVVGANDISGTVGANFTNINSLSNTELRVTTSGLPVSVPEPATLSMLALGLFGIGMRKRRNS